MATTKFYLDRRSVRDDGSSPLKIAISAKGKSALISLGVFILPSQWDEKAGCVVKHLRKQFINLEIGRMRMDVDAFILEMMEKGRLARMSAQDIKQRFTDAKNGTDTFEQRFEAFIARKTGSTRELYWKTLKCLRRYCPKLASMAWEDITVSWLRGFDAFLAQTAPSQNYRNIHLRNIRAVFNDAITDEVTTYYPFRKFKIRPVPTRKRSLTVDALRRLFDYPVEEYAVIYRDMFKLIFMLIGINTVDLHRLKEITSDGRVEYTRAKTHRLYSIKVEPEALAIIERYRGEHGLLSIADRWTDHENFRHQMNKALQNIGCSRTGLGGKKQDDGVFAEITTYWARHSWATIAASLDIPKETIAAALGHGGNTVTDIYIDFDQRKVDEANRRVLDWVLYGRRGLTL